ncbi:MAG: hypothetical protein EGR47_01595 [Clostridium sp.]|nr:hypothetical protein [Clostridium sp.]
MADGILGAGKDFSPEKIFHLLVFAFIYKISHSEENIFYVMADNKMHRAGNKRKTSGFWEDRMEKGKKIIVQNTRIKAEKRK